MRVLLPVVLIIVVGVVFAYALFVRSEGGARRRLMARAHPGAGIDKNDSLETMRVKNRAYLMAGEMANLLERIVAVDEIGVPTLQEDHRAEAERLLAQYRNTNALGE